jgi:hypothetical protein
MQRRLWDKEEVQMKNIAQSVSFLNEFLGCNFGAKSWRTEPKLGRDLKVYSEQRSKAMSSKMG